MMTFDLRSQGSSNIVSTNAFLESHLNRPRSRESQGRYDRTRESHVDDIFDTIIPRTEVVQDGHPHLEVDSEDGDSSSALTSDVQSVRDYEESSFGDVPPMLRTAFSNLGNSSESSAPSPERRSVRSSFKPRVPVPVRHSSRARGQSIESGSDVPDSVFYDGNILGHINAAELEAARKMLAAAELSNQHSPPRSSKKSMEAERSSTPPPIGRVRRRTESDSENGDLVRSLRPTTPETTASLQGGSTLMPLSRRHSQTSMASRQSRRSSKVKSHHATIQSSAYTQNRSSREPNLLAPGTQHSDRPQSRKDEAKGFQADREDTDDFSQHIPESRHGTDRVPRHASFTGSSTSRRPAMTAKRVLSSGALSVSARFQADRRSVLSHASSIRLPDFLSYEIFQAVLRNPTTAHQLLRFSETRLCSQNIEFLNKVDEYQKALGNVTHILASIHKEFISSQPTHQLDVPDDVMRSVYRDIKSLAGRTLPGMETLFTDLQARIEEAVFTDIYPFFVRHQLALSATRALASDRHRYAGLGDCFCLTDPNKTDNPILFASDGFVKVTGYNRPEIIPRNCRFLQGPQTDRVPIKRLKQGISENRESVELILNYKKNGDPFWNLLYVAPLFNESGKVAFFIGGQVNCSTTIHSNADIMKVLLTSASGEMDDTVSHTPSQAVPQKHGPLPTARKALLKAFGMGVDEAKGPAGPSGMEQDVLGRMDGQNLDTQLEEFYTAYSKYLVVRADNFVIQYYSEGVLEVLNPANNSSLIAGQDVFRFLKQNTVGKETDYRNRVRGAIKSGRPISIELRLQTRRSARYRGDEVFATHWTPLKDENAATQWVVITLASAIF